MSHLKIATTALLALFLAGAIAPADAGLASRRVQISPSNDRLPVHSSRPAFRYNDLETTPYGKAQADILLQNSNFLPCKGGPIALCYYSGPEPVACELSRDGRSANCACYEIPYGPFYVDINAILNLDVYLDTVDKCGRDGTGCTTTNSAPVCDVINTGELIPFAEMISTFSFACAPEDGLGQTNCDSAVYAGCMTAPCRTPAGGDPGIVNCACPTWDGPFQIGSFLPSCDIEAGQVWSAAYNPNESGKTFPEPPGCVPDAPGEVGCPLLAKGDIPPPVKDPLCEDVCEEYATCQNEAGTEVGYTCDATLCTSTCTDQDLVSAACDGLSSCDVDAIIALEEAHECSCCASQLCGCEASEQTNTEIRALNERQEERGIVPQCEINDTLCG